MNGNRVGTGICYLIIALVGITVYLPANATKTDDYYEKADRKREYYLQRYSWEIYVYCINRGDVLSKKVKRCMKDHEKLKHRILNEAQRQLGTRTLAQSVYNGCINYYPRNGVARISACARTRLMLRSKLDDRSVDNLIYRTCDRKWRKHEFKAVHNCALHEAIYYLENDQLRDDFLK